VIRATRRSDTNPGRIVETAASPVEAEPVVAGGPTERHGTTEAVARPFGGTAADALRGKTAAAFDVRPRRHQRPSGSAGVDLAPSQRESGVRSIASEESFFVGHTSSRAPVLEQGELERATARARSLAGRTAAACEAG
jgi:hypothetical protein